MIFNKADDPECIEIVFRFNNTGYRTPCTEYENQLGYIDDILANQGGERSVNNIKFLVCVNLNMVIAV